MKPVFQPSRLRSRLRRGVAHIEAFNLMQAARIAACFQGQSKVRAAYIRAVGRMNLPASRGNQTPSQQLAGLGRGELLSDQSDAHGGLSPPFSSSATRGPVGIMVLEELRDLNSGILQAGAWTSKRPSAAMSPPTAYRSTHRLSTNRPAEYRRCTMAAPPSGSGTPQICLPTNSNNRI
jgi:hypothetical protein